MTEPQHGFTVNLSGLSYVAGQDPELVVAIDGRWQLDLTSLNPGLSNGLYDVHATAIDAAGNETVDVTNNELTVDTVGALITVTQTETNDVTPLLSGQIEPGLSSVTQVAITLPGTVPVQTYNWTPTSSSPALVVDLTPPASWHLQIPDGSALMNGTYDIDARIVDRTGQVNIDPTDNELFINTDAPTVTVHPLITANATLS